MADVSEQLERLANLLREGFITREEFDQQKQALFATPSSSGSSSPNVGDSVGAYRILGELGRGGMGVVYRAKHRTAAKAKRQGGEVAIKVLHAQYAQNPLFQERFEREASLGLKLNHPGIVNVYDLVVAEGGRLAIAMELAEGRALSEVIGKETGPIPWEQAWPLFKQLLDAVDYAHTQGVVHRDLKPENVVVSADNQLKILDFGIAKDLEGGKTKTGTGMGTVDYMAPEQYLDAKRVDGRADIYALGMTLYEMLAGRLPWEKDTPEFTILEQKKNGTLPPPTDFYPEIPAAVVAVVERATAVEIEDRYPSVEALSAALEGASGDGVLLIEDDAPKLVIGGGSPSALVVPSIIGPDVHPLPGSEEMRRRHQTPSRPPDLFQHTAQSGPTPPRNWGRLFFSPEGRIGRTDFWQAVLIWMIFGSLGYLAASLLSLSLIVQICCAIFFSFPLICLCHKRCQDFGVQGGFGVAVPLLLWLHLPLFFLILGLMVAIKGTKGANRFGEAEGLGFKSGARAVHPSLGTKLLRLFVFIVGVLGGTILLIFMFYGNGDKAKQIEIPLTKPIMQEAYGESEFERSFIPETKRISDIPETKPTPDEDRPTEAGVPEGVISADPDGINSVIGGVEGGVIGGQLGGTGVRAVHWSEVRVKRRPSAHYPKSAINLNLGPVDCRVRIFIDARGRPYDVRMESCPNIFRDNAKQTAMKYRFYPMKVAGESVPCQFVLSMRFNPEWDELGWEPEPKAAAAEAATNELAVKTAEVSGLISISSWPKSKIYINDVYLSSSPLSRHNLPIGVHKIRLVAADGRQHQFEVESVQGRPVARIWHFDEQAWID